VARTATKTRNTRNPSTRARAERAEKVAGLVAQIADRAQELATAEGWQRMLIGAASGLWRYSLNNQLLILAQAGERGFSPTQVAGYQTWRSRGRQVRSGEKGLSILAPAGTFLVDVDETEHAGQGRIIELPDGTKKREITRYRPTYVWDISQTDRISNADEPEVVSSASSGPTTAAPCTDLTVRVVDLEELRSGLSAQVATAGYALSYGTPTAGADGHTDPHTKTVVVSSQLAPLEQVATLAHELAHIALGHCAPTYAYHAHRGRAEVEAESVAYVLLGACGLDMTDAPIRYVAGWAGNDIDTIRAAAATVTKTAKSLLDELLTAEDNEPADGAAA
jgi:antirestriction protein ArdC